MIGYRLINTPLGETVLGRKDGKICFCHFAIPSLEAVLQRVVDDFPGEELRPVLAQEWFAKRGEIAMEQLLQGRYGSLRWEDLHLEGTPLQLAVWREIFNLHPDELISYSALAARCGYPKAVRAVATAVGKNPISLIIPCHRVLRQEAFQGNGVIRADMLGNYEWGKELKRRILEWEGLI